MCLRSVHLLEIRVTSQDGAGPDRLVHHVARVNMEDQADCEPVFVTTRALPSRHVSPDTIDLCTAAERTTGRGTIRGRKGFADCGASTPGKVKLDRNFY